ncbi:MAG: NYN domain-containing protein [Nitriliruptorales bacterium]|nr:NYN domain-containing protein [Nitriliruptorales bacterium]
MPTPQELLALDADRWALVVTNARRALQELDDHLLTPELRRLRALPTSKLASGQTRRRLAEALSQGPIWGAVQRRIVEGSGPDPRFRSWLEGTGNHPVQEPTVPEGEPASATGGVEQDADHSGEIQRLKDRARSFQEQRDDARRRLEGAEARASNAESDVSDLREELGAAHERIAELEAAQQRAEEERRRSVEREQRRNESQVSALEEELRTLRRTLHERDRELERLRAGAERASEAGTERGERPEADDELPRDDDIVPGRPTELPARIRAGTAEYADALLERGRTVVVDGYNVSLRHRGHLSLEEQRNWLIRLLRGAATGRGLDPVVVFDGDRGGVQGAGRHRGVEVAFADDHEADDEIEFRVAALPPDEPVTVVTDDRELAGRVRRYGADVIGTGPFLWVVE